MPDEMFDRGRRDAEADALDENFYQYYYHYRLGYDEVVRNRRRSRRQLLLARVGRRLLTLLPVLLITAGAAFAAYRYVNPSDDAAQVPAPTSTPRPTVALPTREPLVSPTPELVLRADGYAVVTGTGGATLLGRRGPGRGNPALTRFPEGKVVKVLEGPQSADDMQWWRVELDGQSGWSAEPFLKPIPAP